MRLKVPWTFDPPKAQNKSKLHLALDGTTRKYALSSALH